MNRILHSRLLIYHIWPIYLPGKLLMHTDIPGTSGDLKKKYYLLKIIFYKNHKI